VWYITLIYRDVTKQLWLLCSILVSLLTTVKYYIIAILHRIISCEARIRFLGIYSWTKYTLSVFVLSPAGQPIYPHSPQVNPTRRNISGRFWKSVLFWWLQTTPILVEHETGGVGKLISLFFQAYVDRSNQMLYMSCASIWKQYGSRLWIIIKPDEYLIPIRNLMSTDMSINFYLWICIHIQISTCSLYFINGWTIALLNPTGLVAMPGKNENWNTRYFSGHSWA
jgi:hypothetical protein